MELRQAKIMLLNFASLVVFFVLTAMANLIPIFGPILVASTAGQIMGKAENENSRVSRSGTALGVILGSAVGPFFFLRSLLWTGVLVAVSIIAMAVTYRLEVSLDLQQAQEVRK
ncbi:MAG: hypothetical protein HZA95_03780 [Candidatus Vogelbacteria bacterium]|nr:hypothetical protein [Candidatus Vogelbacteria bacterium]